MATRSLYIVRHGLADAFGELTEVGRRQANLLGERLATVPVDAVWHSPLPRAADTALEMARHLSGVPVAEAAELLDHVPYVPNVAEMPASWTGFFGGYGQTEADSGQRLAQALVDRFAHSTDPAAGTRADVTDQTHEVLVTHAYPIAWLVRDALEAPPVRWLNLTGSANTALTILEYRHGVLPTLAMFNDMSHLPTELRWTGFPERTRP